MNQWHLRPNSFACPDLLRSASRSMAGRCAGWVAGIKPGFFSSSWFFATEGPSDGRICTSAVCHDCIPLHVADEAAARAGADHALGYEPVSERFVMVSVSLIGEADASFARFAPENDRVRVGMRRIRADHLSAIRLPNDRHVSIACSPVHSSAKK